MNTDTALQQIREALGITGENFKQMRVAGGFWLIVELQDTDTPARAFLTHLGPGSIPIATIEIDLEELMGETQGDGE